MKKLIMTLAIVATVSGVAIAHGPGFQNQGGYNNGMMGNDYNQGMMGNGYNQQYGNNRGMMGPNGYQQGMQGNGYQQGMGQGRGMMMGQGMMNGNVKPLTTSEAKAAVENVIKTDFKGYKITSVDKFKMPMGLLYIVNVKDSKGVKGAFHVNPMGFVVGPFKAVK